MEPVVAQKARGNGFPKVSSFVMAYDQEHGYPQAKAPGHEYNKYHDHHQYAPIHSPEAHDHHHRDEHYKHHLHAPMHAPEAYDHHHDHDEHNKHHPHAPIYAPKTYDHQHDHVEHDKHHPHAPIYAPEAYDRQHDHDEHDKHHPHAPMHAPEAHDHHYDHDEHSKHHSYAPMHAPEAYDHDDDDEEHHHHDEHDHHHDEHYNHHDEDYKHHSHAPMHPPEAHDHHDYYGHRHHAYAPGIAPMHSKFKLGAPSPYMAHMHVCLFKCKHYCEKDHDKYDGKDHNKYGEKDHDKYNDKDQEKYDGKDQGKYHDKKWRCIKACTACCDKCKCVPEGEKKCMEWENVYIKGRKSKEPLLKRPFAQRHQATGVLKYQEKEDLDPEINITFSIRSRSNRWKKAWPFAPSTCSKPPWTTEKKACYSPDVGLGVVLQRSYGVVLPAEPMVFQGLHQSNASGTLAHRIHLLDFE
ncbi:hypothetical protein RHMOL_Rhmol08G0068900 [Rhododendron molle]|uniref:Uncharacterized protein n=1 Tax=Rhododendron molle TaxID=49168 RepID=A0ACC0MLN1_RHOML|nr:hypothetical protein RHMOL_Rhmol08G0068900 [Rhododendron molle]